MPTLPQATGISTRKRRRQQGDIDPSSTSCSGDSWLNLAKLFWPMVSASCPLAAKSTGPLLSLLYPVVFWYCAKPQYKGVVFVLTTFLTIRLLLRAQAARPSVSKSRAGTEWGQHQLKGKVTVKFPVELKRVIRYLENRPTLSMVHIAVKALGMALKEVPELNGHAIMGHFYPASTIDVSAELKLKDGSVGLFKVPMVDKKSPGDVATSLSAKSAAIRDGTDVFHRRRLAITRVLAPIVERAMERCFAVVGSGLGIGVPALGIRPFPQGTATVISPMQTGSKSATGSELLVEPDEDGRDFTHLLLTIGAVHVKPRLDANRKPIMVPVLSVSICARLHGAEPQSVQKLSQIVQMYMSDPLRLEDGNGDGVGGGSGSAEEKKDNEGLRGVVPAS